MDFYELGYLIVGLTYFLSKAYWMKKAKREILFNQKMQIRETFKYTGVTKERKSQNNF